MWQTVRVAPRRVAGVKAQLVDLVPGKAIFRSLWRSGLSAPR